MEWKEGRKEGGRSGSKEGGKKEGRKEEVWREELERRMKGEGRNEGRNLGRKEEIRRSTDLGRVSRVEEGLDDLFVVPVLGVTRDDPGLGQAHACNPTAHRATDVTVSTASRHTMRFL